MKQHKDATIELDSFHAQGEKFSRCHFVYRGGQPPTLVNCTFNDCTFAFEGPAGDTLALLARLYHGGFRGLVEQTFANIMKNDVAAKLKLH
jgi:hypothetical protein